LGDASYALYLAHPFVVRGLRMIAEATGLAPLLGPGPLVLLMLAASAAAAILVHRIVERPLTRAVRALLAPPPGPAPAVNKI